FDQYARERRQRSLRALGDEIAQRVLQVGARVTAQAAVAEQRDIVGRGAHERIVDADAAELVDDDRGARAFRRREKAAHQRGLAGTEKARDHGHRDARAARTLEPAPEPACLAGRKEIEHESSPRSSPSSSAKADDPVITGSDVGLAVHASEVRAHWLPTFPGA